MEGKVGRKTAAKRHRFSSGGPRNIPTFTIALVYFDTAVNQKKDSINGRPYQCGAKEEIQLQLERIESGAFQLRQRPERPIKMSAARILFTHVSRVSLN